MPNTCQSTPTRTRHRSGTHAGQENIVVGSPRENALDTPFTPKCNGRSGVATGDEDSILLQEMLSEIGQRNGSVLGIAFEEYNVRWLAIASRVCSMEQLGCSPVGRRLPGTVDKDCLPTRRLHQLASSCRACSKNPAGRCPGVRQTDCYGRVCEETTADRRGNDAKPLSSAHQVSEIGRIELTVPLDFPGEPSES